MMWFLYLNRMTEGAEHRCLVAYAGSKRKAELEAWVAGELAPEPYYDGQWHKVFRKGSRLEWYNPPEHDSYRLESLPAMRDPESLLGDDDQKR